MDFFSMVSNPERFSDLKIESNNIISQELRNYHSNIDQNYEWEYFSGLHVHHTYYIKDLMPWQYNDKALKSLCLKCHENLHKNQKIPVYNSEKEFHCIGEFSYCSRCNGAGWLPEYKYVQGGICFECWGAKYKELVPLSF